MALEGVAAADELIDGALIQSELFRLGKLGAREFLEAAAPAARVLQRALPEFATEEEAIRAVRVLLFTAAGEDVKFRSSHLESGYLLYVQMKSRLGETPRGRWEWATKQMGHSRYLVELRRLLGTQHDVLIGIKQPRIRTAYLSTPALRVYRQFHQKIMPYREFDTIRKHGVFNADHLLEARFWRMAGLGQTEEMPALLVPRDTFDAGLLRASGLTAPYAHTIKTALMEELIPWRIEHKFSSQQVFDAHAAVFMRLGLDTELWESGVVSCVKTMAPEHDGVMPDFSLGRIDQTLFEDWYPELL